MRKKGFFITGTDTGVGKTFATLWLMQALRERGLSVVGMKPVATGAVWRGGVLVNEDALALQAAASIPLPYAQVNPYVFEPPTSPHIAAAAAGQKINLERIVETFEELRDTADCILVEGVGGWKVPLNEREQVADLARVLGLPVILVVGLRLGCLNHALLTEAAFAASGTDFAGWIANRIVGDLPYLSETLRTLGTALGNPPLISLPYCAGARQPPQDIRRDPLPEEILRVLAP